MKGIFWFPEAAESDPAVRAWIDEHSDALGAIAARWFDALRACGDDVRELMHDGHPTACVSGAAFAYVDAFRAHVNLGFYRGAELPDPGGLLQGNGRHMRHVKLRPGEPVDSEALSWLIETACEDMRRRIAAEGEAT